MSHTNVNTRDSNMKKKMQRRPAKLRECAYNLRNFKAKNFWPNFFCFYVPKFLKIKQVTIFFVLLNFEITQNKIVYFVTESKSNKIEIPHIFNLACTKF